MKNPLLIVQLDIKLPNYLIRSSKMGIVNQNVLIGSIKKFNKIKLIAAKTTQDIVIQENRGWERDKNLYIIQCAFFHNNRKCSYILVDSDDTKQGKAWRGSMHQK